MKERRTERINRLYKSDLRNFGHTEALRRFNLRYLATVVLHAKMGYVGYQQDMWELLSSDCAWRLNVPAAFASKVYQYAGFVPFAGFPLTPLKK